MDSGTRPSAPAIAASRNAPSDAVRAIGPSTDIAIQWFFDGNVGTRPGEGRRPNTWLKLPGLRRLPPRSVPSAKGSMCIATDTAAPPDEPPQVRSRFHGLRVAPNTRLNVCEPIANSGVLVLPITTMPCSRKRDTISESKSGTQSR